MAHLVGMLAGLVAGDQFDHPQRHAGIASPEGLQRIQCQRPAGALGCQEEDLVEFLYRAGLEHREQGGDGLADAGGCLCQQAAAESGGVEHGLREVALSRPEFLVRKPQACQCCVAPFPVCQFSICPCDEALAQGLEEGLQFDCRALLRQRRRLLLAADVEVHQRHGQLGQVELPAQQRTVDLGLRPVQMPVVGGHEVEVALEGLDLLQQATFGIEAIGTPAHDQVPVRRRSTRLRCGTTPNGLPPRSGGPRCLAGRSAKA